MNEINLFYFTLTVLTAAGAALCSVRWAYFKILKIAKDKNLVDNPDARKLQKEPVPVVGGIAVFFGVAIGTLMGAAMHAMPSILSHEAVTWASSDLLPVICAMIVMLYTGAMDDIIGLSPRTRLIIEMLVVSGVVIASGGCIDTFRGMWGIREITWWLAFPMTVLTGVSIINAINMIDGVNGLSSGLCMTCSVFFAMAFTRIGDTANAILAYSMTAAMLPFFVHNVMGRSSRMFIGDAGTMVMGMLLTWFTISTLRANTPLPYYTPVVRTNMIAMCLAILSVPVFDTLRVILQRLMRHQSPFLPDKTHLHHVFIEVGVSHNLTSLTEILIDLSIVGIWGLCVVMRVSLEWQLYVVVIASLVLVWGTYAFLRYHATHQTRTLQRITKFAFITDLSRRKYYGRLQEWLDAPEKELHDADPTPHLRRRFGAGYPTAKDTEKGKAKK